MSRELADELERLLARAVQSGHQWADAKVGSPQEERAASTMRGTDRDIVSLLIGNRTAILAALRAPRADEVGAVEAVLRDVRRQGEHARKAAGRADEAPQEALYSWAALGETVTINLDVILAALRAPRPAEPEAVEAVARAIAQADGFYLDGEAEALWVEHWQWFLEFRGATLAADRSNQARWERMARAALAAIRPADPGPGVEAVLPYDVTVGPVTFHRGVSFSTFVGAAKRWHATAAAAQPEIDSAAWNNALAALPQPASDMQPATDAASDRNRPAAGGPVVALVEMEDWSQGYAQPAPPVWRVELAGCVADFEHEQAARNWASAIVDYAVPATGEARAGVERVPCAKCGGIGRYSAGSEFDPREEECDGCGGGGEVNLALAQRQAGGGL